MVEERGNGKEKEKESFWTSLPGILTAVGGIIVAIAALVTAMGGAGLFGGQSASPPLSIITTSPAVPGTIVTAVQETTAAPFTFTVVPSTARRGQEVTLYFSRLPMDVRVYLNGRALPKKHLGDTLVITIPSDADSGIIEVFSPDNQQTASATVTVLP